MPVAVRAALPGDEGRLLALYEWLFAAPGSKPAAWDERRAAGALRSVIESDDATVLVADDGAGGEIVGFATVYRDIDSVRFGPRAWVEDLAVAPGRRSQGIGKRLLDAAREWARDRGATHLELDSGDARHDAHRFYERERPDWTSRQFSWLL